MADWYGVPDAPEGPAVPPRYWHDDEEDERRRYHTEELGLNREPSEEDPGFSEEESNPRGRPHPFGTPIYNPRSSPYSDHPPSFSAARRPLDRLWLEAAANREARMVPDPVIDRMWLEAAANEELNEFPSDHLPKTPNTEVTSAPEDWWRREPVTQRWKPKNGAVKTSWSGWGPAQFPKHHTVADWEWDNHLNGYVSKTGSLFHCECGEPVPVPSFRICTCGRQWNSYGIGTGGDLHTANTEMFLCREIPTRKDIICP